MTGAGFGGEKNAASPEFVARGGVSADDGGGVSVILRGAAEAARVVRVAFGVPRADVARWTPSPRRRMGPRRARR